MKQCTKCKKLKPKSEFYKNKSLKDGLHFQCKKCTYICTKKSFDKRKKLFKEYKKTLKCQRCGENHIACLDFHHKNPAEKDFQIGVGYCSNSIKRIKEEIAKCDVLCANCHKKLHYNENL